MFDMSAHSTWQADVYAETTALLGNAMVPATRRVLLQISRHDTLKISGRRDAGTNGESAVPAMSLKVRKSILAYSFGGHWPTSL
jgi:hypothetical protein